MSIAEADRAADRNYGRLPIESHAGEDPPFLELCRLLHVDTDTAGWPDRFGAAVTDWSRSAPQTQVRTISLFSGAGGLDIGFHDAGFDIIEMVELNEAYAASLRHNAVGGGYLGRGCVRNMDIRDYLPHDTCEGEIGLLIGGPPCQTFSAAGRRASGVPGTSEARGTLFMEYVRVLEQLRPTAFVFENVYGITGAEGGRAWEQIRSEFAAAGYQLAARVLDAADFGVPQHRERMFIVGTKAKGFQFPRPTHGPDSPGCVPFYTAGDALADIPLPKDTAELVPNGQYAHLLEDIPPGLNYSFYTEKMGHPRPLFAWRSKFSDFLYKADPARPVRTIKAFCGQYTGPFHWTGRRFTTAELKRLQTFPDSYVLVGSRSQVEQQIGNSVPPQLARIIALSILQQVFNVSLPTALPLLTPHAKLGFRSRKIQMTDYYRRQAHKALAQMERKSPRDALKRTQFTCCVTQSFDFMRSDSAHPYHVDIVGTERELLVSVSEGQADGENKWRIVVEPAPGQAWVLPCARVVMQGDELDRHRFLAAWKSFDWWLHENRLKDDLVQLCGYYAYSPAIRCRMLADGHRGSLWPMVARVVGGRGVRRTLPTAVMASELGVPPGHAPEALLELKSLGYEVRSRSTNSQIEEDHFLIPYAFPTFNPRSVQLYKELFPGCEGSDR